MSGKWIEWNGGDNPCPPGAVVEWQTRAMPEGTQHWEPRAADVLDWRHRGYHGAADDIVAFRIVGDVVMRDQHDPATSKDHGIAQAEIPRESDESILREAERIVGGDRRQDYGDMQTSFARIAGMWSIILGGARVTPRDVARCMIALKLTRDCNRAKRDNLVDIAGYAHCAQQLEDVP